MPMRTVLTPPLKPFAYSAVTVVDAKIVVLGAPALLVRNCTVAGDSMLPVVVVVVNAIST